MERRSMFSARTAGKPDDVIAATTSFIIDKRKKEIRELSPNGKMLCAFRKVLASMSDKDPHGRRYFIANNAVQILKAPTANEGRPGEPRTYHAKGRCILGATLSTGELKSNGVAFEITFQDVVDERGLPDVRYIEPTSIDDLTGTPIDLSALST